MQRMHFFNNSRILIVSPSSSEAAVLVSLVSPSRSLAKPGHTKALSGDGLYTFGHKPVYIRQKKIFM
ncbi:hypothetical protein D3C81_1297370 [compost metagenome]